MTACKAVYTGSIPVGAFPYVKPKTRCRAKRRRAMGTRYGYQLAGIASLSTVPI